MGIPIEHLLGAAIVPVVAVAARALKLRRGAPVISVATFFVFVLWDGLLREALGESSVWVVFAVCTGVGAVVGLRRSPKVLVRPPGGVPEEYDPARHVVPRAVLDAADGEVDRLAAEGFTSLGEVVLYAGSTLRRVTVMEHTDPASVGVVLTAVADDGGAPDVVLYSVLPDGRWVSVTNSLRMHDWESVCGTLTAVCCPGVRSADALWQVFRAFSERAAAGGARSRPPGEGAAGFVESLRARVRSAEVAHGRFRRVEGGDRHTLFTIARQLWHRFPLGRELEAARAWREQDRLLNELDLLVPSVARRP